jgi:hypothetical protein
MRSPTRKPEWPSAGRLTRDGLGPEWKVLHEAVCRASPARMSNPWLFVEVGQLASSEWKTIPNPITEMSHLTARSMLAPLRHSHLRACEPGPLIRAPVAARLADAGAKAGRGFGVGQRGLCFATMTAGACGCGVGRGEWSLAGAPTHCRTR